MASGSTFRTQRRPEQRLTTMWSPFAYHNRKIVELVRSLVDESGAAARGRVLDYGCADAPYRDELPDGATYIGADLEGNPTATVTLLPDGSLPLPNDDVDLVLSTQVLEHVDDPALYLTECFRVLRPGGKLILSTHGIMYYHLDPVDHWRWTRTGLTKTVEAAGFSVTKMRGMMGLVAAALQLIQDGTYFYLPRFLRPAYAFVMQNLIALIDRRYSEESRVNNGLILAVLATKPAA
jgi:SAM-dependent methyltransferase